VDPTRIELDGVAVRDNDSDSDGLPDDWEQFYFTNLTQTASADTDNDGSINIAEYRAGTNPASTTSVLQFLAVSRDDSGRVTLLSSHAASRAYSVEFSEAFGQWNPLTNAPTFHLGTNVAEWRDTNGPSQRFYRLRAD